GSFQVNPWATAGAALGMVLAPIYALLILQKGFFGPPSAMLAAGVADLSSRELLMLGLLAAGLVILGFWPNLILDLSAAPIHHLQQSGG
ncbi:MAG: NADH-quinone oxidoreductase subunit M, partial [Gammaproteobacteria bacterium]|nr:NADH-quinone oxidoreductase subunit M [Gammaproteobacteria bacterium]